MTVIQRLPKSHDWEAFPEFESHAAAGRAFDDLFSPHFEISSEICLRGTRGDRFRIDRVISDGKFVLGVEIKPKMLFPKHYSAALKQAADYRDAAIHDAKLAHLRGQQLLGVLVFPRWTGLHDTGVREYAFEAVGMEMLAEKFRVGAAGTQKGLAAISMGEGRMWTSRIGWSDNADRVFFGKRAVGSGRRVDSQP